MKIRVVSILTVATLAIAACSESDTAAKENAPTQADETTSVAGVSTSAEDAGQVYSAEGDVTEVSAGLVTISHGPVEAIGWPAMTMGFRPASPELLQGIAPGDPVSFEFRKSGSEYVLTSVRKTA